LPGDTWLRVEERWLPARASWMFTAFKAPQHCSGHLACWTERCGTSCSVRRWFFCGISASAAPSNTQIQADAVWQWIGRLACARPMSSSTDVAGGIQIETANNRRHTSGAQRRKFPARAGCFDSSLDRPFLCFYVPSSVQSALPDTLCLLTHAVSLRDSLDHSSLLDNIHLIVLRHSLLLQPSRSC
jgi:hypothetical protein